MSIAYGLVWIDSVGVLVLGMLGPIHLLSLIVYQNVTRCIMISILLIATWVWILASSIAQWCYDYILNIVVDR